MECLRTQLLLKTVVAGFFLSRLAVAPAQEPVAGPNVNMVSGITWPGGDPFLQRQNEPTLAISSRNPLHLLGGANDYRTVDLPGLPDAEKVVGDAWLGLFKSINGGQTWTSTLLPGYPQDNSPAGLASPLKGLQAGADPTIRAGTNGMFFYSGIAFNRGSSPQGKIFVARFIDDNSKRSSDPFRYISTAVIDTGNAGQFVDKPWLGVDRPRTGSAMCTIPASQGIPAQRFAAGNVYIAYASVVGGETTAKLRFSRSTDCGATWSMPQKLNEGDLTSQGSAIAIAPETGAVYVFWRNFPSGVPNPVAVKDAELLFARSTDFGRTFTKPARIAMLNGFDQGTSSVSFRTSAFPTAAVDAAGKIYVAWSQRGWVAAVDSRIVMITSTDGGQTWSTPAPVDTAPRRGHQVMPSLSFARGKLLLVYYHLQEDHTSGELKCLSQECLATLPALRTTAMFTEVRNLEGDLAPPPNLTYVFNDFIADAVPPAFTLPTPLKRRHTIDVRAAQMDPATGLWSFTRVSQYLYGSPSRTPGIAEPIKQLRFNVGNLPLFGLGTKAFVGDYLDIGAPAFLFDAALNQWRFDHRPDNNPLFHAVWTDNRDVRPPRDGNWANYTPPKPAGVSLFDPTRSTQPCTDDFKAGMRNQNIYTSRITQGVAAGALTNTKPLSSLQRAFSIFVQNGTNIVKYYRLNIVSPAGVVASFIPQAQPPLPFPLTVIEAAVPPRSSASRTVFATSAAVAGRIIVNVTEITGLMGGEVTGGQKTSIILNPDLTNPDLTNPDLTNPDLTHPDLTNPDLTNPDLTNPDLTNPDLTNPDLTNPDLTNPDLTNPDLTNPGIPNPDLTNPDLTNPDLTNPDLTNGVIGGGNIIDATWRVTNRGNTATSYSVKTLFRNQQLPPGIRVQLLLTRTYATPAVRNCQVKQELQNVLVTNIPNPVLIDAASGSLLSPDLTNPDLKNATISLAAGETGNITLRVIDLDTRDGGVQLCGTPTQPCDPNNPNQLNPGEAFQPIPVAQANNTGSPTPSIPLIITTLAVADATVGTAYNSQLQAVGGAGTTTWSVVSGTLPPGITLNPSTGMLAGTPTNSGIYSFTVQASGGTQSDVQRFTITVAPAATSLLVYEVQPSNATANTAPSPLVLRLTDSTGAAIGGATVSISLTGNPSAASITSVTSGATAATGRIEFSPVINRGGTGYVLSASTSGLPPVASIPFTVQGLSTNLPAMTTPRHSHTAMLLPTGKVLIWGGTDSPTIPISATTSLPSPRIEVYDPVTNTISAVPPGSDTGGGRINHTAVLLPQGLILITGGRTSSGTVTAEQQLVLFGGATPSTGIAASLPVPAREYHTATVLGDGRRVLIAGGGNTSSPALSDGVVFDPQAATFVPVTMNVARRNHTATLLGNGKVLIAGGYGTAGAPLATAELFDPATNAFTFVPNPGPIPGSMAQPRARHAAVLLASGYVLLTGGDGTVSEFPATSTSEYYNPSTNSFTPLSSMSTPRRGHEMTLLASGKVLISGGSDATGYSASMELFDPASGFSVVSGTAVTGPRMGLAATRLADGRVLLSGGTNATTTSGISELFHPINPPFAPAAFAAGPSLGVARAYFTMTRLPNGKILIAGGQSATGLALNAASVYDPISGAITPTANPLVSARSHHTAVLLSTGKVLLAGGFGAAGPQASMELYDPETNTFTSAGALNLPRAQHTATLLHDGTVLFAGGLTAPGSYLADARIYNPFTATLSPVASGMAVARAGHTATLLGSAYVLLTGGQNGTGPQSSAEVYDYNVTTFTPGGTMSSARREHTATLLPNGNVLVVGGHDGTNPLATAEIYNLTTGTWTAGGTMVAGTTHFLHTATMLPSGKVLIDGGVGGPDAQIYDAATASFSKTAVPATGRHAHSAILLPNGRILIGGGSASASGPILSTTELYNPAP